MPTLTSAIFRSNEALSNGQGRAALVPSENKRQVTLRLDADVLSFFKETG